ncbi:MAG: hypothetical protein HRF43_03750 [Phycisphaerae bacterium]
MHLYAHEQANGYTRVERLSTGMHGAVVVAETPFYAEGGGQVGDRGTIETTTGRFLVEDTIKVGDVYFHLGQVTAGQLLAADRARLTLSVDEPRRRRIMAHHTVTHLLNFALREVLGDHVQQKGSLVDEEKTRFDFSHGEALRDEQIDRIEQIVNELIAHDLTVYDGEAPQEEAMRINGLRAVFGERYPPRVRIVSVGVPVEELIARPSDPRWRGYSIELCGGTHLGKTGDAEGFVILSEETVAKGVRRLVAVTGEAAHRAQADAQRLLNRLEALRAAQDIAELRDRNDLVELAQEINEVALPLLARKRLNAGIGELHQLLKEDQRQRSKQVVQSVIEEARRIAQEVSGDLIVARIADADADALRTAMDVIRKKHPEAALLLAGVTDGKVALVAAVPESKIKQGLKAGDWVRETAKVVGGGGGGRPDMAQAGGKDPSRLDEALDKARQFASEKVGA